MDLGIDLCGDGVTLNECHVSCHRPDHTDRSLDHEHGHVSRRPPPSKFSLRVPVMLQPVDLDIRRALQLTSDITSFTPSDRWLDGDGSGSVDMLDCVSIARGAAGAAANPWRPFLSMGGWTAVVPPLTCAGRVCFAARPLTASFAQGYSGLMPAPILSVELPFPKVRSGKVREMFDLGDALLMVASDRISAFDCIMPNGIPDKGRVLTQTSLFWFNTLKAAVPHHVLAEWTDVADRYGLDESVLESANLEGRALVVKKTEPLAIECVVRGYISGSLWKEYRAATAAAGPGASVTLHGYAFPAGLVESQRLPEPIFTPATKAETGHDINIDVQQAAGIVGEETAALARDRSLALYAEAADYAARRGIIIADTKFEFGRRDGDLILIDEILTPDSSRFWPADSYEPGRPQPSFDKQFLRDYLETLDWDKTPPAPALPEDIIEKTAAKYREAYERLTGTPLPPGGS